MTEENVTDAEIVEETTAEEVAAPTAPQQVYPRQNVAGPEWDVHEAFMMQTEVHLWEHMSESSINFKMQQLEESELQIRGTMEQIEANGGAGNQDWKQLEARHNEVVRQLEHFKKTVKAGDIVYKAKTVGFTNVHVGTDWNRSLQRHVVVNSDGKVERTLVRSPV